MSNLRNYVIVTAAYWAFTLTDGALRMLVLLHFHGLGYSPVELAFLFVFYEFFGVVTNLVGGWIAARLGLAHHAGRRTRAAGAGACNALAAGPRMGSSRVGHVRDGRAGSLRRGQGPHQDELQERHQGAGARGCSFVAVQVGRNFDRVQERPQGGRILPGRSPARDPWLPLRAARNGSRALHRPARLESRAAGRHGTGQGEERSSAAFSRRAARSTCSPRRDSSCSAPATSGSSSACRCSCRHSCRGDSRRWVDSSPPG